MPNEVPRSPFAAHREAVGLSKSETARRSGTPRQAVVKLDGGGPCVVQYKQLVALGEVLNADPRELVGPGQSILCASREELDELVGSRPVRGLGQPPDNWQTLWQTLAEKFSFDPATTDPDEVSAFLSDTLAEMAGTSDE